MNTVLLLTGLTFIRTLLLVLNIRAIAKGWIVTTVTSDALISALAFVLVVRVVEAHNWTAMLGYVIGDCAGSVSGMLITRHWKEANA
jgi:hypothetical protein